MRGAAAVLALAPVLVLAALAYAAAALMQDRLLYFPARVGVEQASAGGLQPWPDAQHFRGLLAPLPITATRLSGAHRLVAVDMHGWPQVPPGDPARDEDEDGRSAPGVVGRWIDRHFGDDADGDGRPDHRFGLTETMSRALDTMQAQIARVQLALDPPELVIRIPRDACQFYEFWRAAELVEIGRREADKALDAAGY